MDKEKQIEEMAISMCGSHMETGNCVHDERSCEQNCIYGVCAERLYDAGYRKQSEGEWIEQIKTTTNAKGMTAHYTINFCSNCGYEIGTIRYQHKYCPNCGAKMKGGE